MRIHNQKKYNILMIYILIIVALSLLMIAALFRIDKILAIIGKIIKVLSPVIWGFVIAYLLNPIMKLFEKLISKIFFKKKPHPKALRRISVTLTILLFVSLVSLLCYIVIPEIVESVKSIFSNFDTWIDNVQKIFDNIMKDNPSVNDFIKNEFDSISTYLQGFIDKLQPNLEKFVTDVTKGMANFLIGIKDFLLGIIVSIYLLLGKEKLIAQVKKVTLALFSKNTCKRIFNVYHKSNNLFIGFVGGKIIDSIIIGIICFIIMKILNMPYYVLISVIIGVTNVIPFFGPIIGAIPSALLVFLAKPSDLIPFLIFILILQQFDGNILGPRIIGNSIGLPAFWVLFSIFLGGGLFGFTGMLLGVPTFALIYALFREYIEDKLESKHLPTETSAYSGNVEKFYIVKRAKDMIDESSDKAEYDKYMIDKINK